MMLPKLACRAPAAERLDIQRSGSAPRHATRILRKGADARHASGARQTYQKPAFVKSGSDKNLREADDHRGDGYRAGIDSFNNSD